MNDREAVAELTSKLGLLVDARDWSGLEALFCMEVELDYTSLQGGEPQRLSPAELVGGWRDNLEPLEETHHLIASHVVDIDGDAAIAAANVTGTHIAREAPTRR